MSKRPEFLGMKQFNIPKRRERVIVLLIVVGVGLLAAKLWNDSQCTSWLTSTEGAKVACIGTVGDDAKNAAEKARGASKR